MSFHRHQFPFLFATFLLCFHHSAHAADFCVADLTTQTPAGYACKDPAKVTAGDFVFTGLTNRGNTSNPNKAVGVLGLLQQFPALNGMGLSIVRADFEPSGVIQLHTHPAASELVYVAEGTLTTGFVAAATNKVYLNTIKKGEVTVFPKGLLHFVMNADTVKPAMAVVVFSDPEPGNQLVNSALFGNDLASALVEKTTGIGEAEVKRLKALLGGSG
ncbi:Germin-like protein [Linum grandiflorum]